MAARETVIVLIAGASGSGKSEVSQILQSLLEQAGRTSVTLPMDDYYKPRPPEVTAENLVEYKRTKNFDHPDALDLDLFHSHLEMLANGEAVERPVYDFIPSDRTEKTVRVEPTEIIIVDGIFALHDVSRLNRIKENLVKIYVESDCYLYSSKRRASRDKQTRGRDEIESRKHELKTVRFAFFQFIAPCKHGVDHVITNNLQTDDEDKAATSAETKAKIAAQIIPQLKPVIEDIERKLSKVSTATMSPGR